jgi:hypothetical protein
LHTDADSLSRAPHADPPRDDIEEEIITLGAMSHLESVLEALFVEQECRDTLKKEQDKDPDIRVLMQIANRQPTMGKIHPYYRDV